MAWDQFFKYMIKTFLKDFNINTSVSVLSKEREIDIVIEIDDLNKKKAVPDGFSSLLCLLNKINLIEFKSSHDFLENKDFFLTWVYYGLYALANKMKYLNYVANANFIFVISALPNFIQNFIRKGIVIEGIPEIKETTNKKGFYKINFPFNCYILNISELSDIEKDLFLLLNAEGDKLKEVLREIYKMDFSEKIKNEGLLDILYDCFILNYEDLKDMEELESLFDDEKIRNNVKQAIKALGIKKVIDAVGLKEVIDAVGLKEVIDAVGLKEVIDAVGLKEVIDAVGLKEIFREIDWSNLNEELKKEILEKIKK
ncbi:MAG: hypothetical protein ACTSRZ_02895 [Promethearchaeota archaeon]